VIVIDLCQFLKTFVMCIGFSMLYVILEFHRPDLPWIRMM